MHIPGFNIKATNADKRSESFCPVFDELLFSFLLNSVRTMDPARKEARIRATRERIEDLEGRQQALRAEQEDLIVHAVPRGHRGD